MSDELKRKGGCMCGAVSYELTLKAPKVHVCHCNNCQKWGGTSGFSIQCEGDWTSEGEENLKWFDSSEWAQRGFCSKCGSHLLFRLLDGSYHGVTAASLNDMSGLTIDSHIFIDKKPGYYDFTGAEPRLTEEEFLQMIGGADGHE